MKQRFFLIIATLLATLTLSAKEQPEWLKKAAIYHIYPSSYMDSNGDGMGDINGICSKLDYIKSVGFNCIWLSPCFVSGWEDGGYDVIDFYKVDPRFGTNEDLKRLFDTAHAKGIKVLLDLVAGHTSDKHPWFKESLKAERNEYSDYYIWTEGQDMPLPGKRWVYNNHPRNGIYLSNYLPIQPALNYGYYKPNQANSWEQDYDAPGPKAVREELKRIIAYWCDMGADGFRVDMANSLVKGDNVEQDGVKRLWKEIFAWYNAKYPDNIMLAEWSNPKQAISAGFNIDILTHHYVGAEIYRPLVCETTDKMAPNICYFTKKGEGRVRESMEKYTEVYNDYRRIGGYAALPTCSHDIWRLTRMNRNTPEEQKVVITLFLTLPTPPIVYYGEEIGMRNLDYALPKEGSFTRRNRSVCRTPMQWNAERNAGFSTVEDASKLYLPVDNAFSFPNVAEQENNPNSVLSYVKGLLALRAKTPALGVEGEWKYVGDMDNPYPMIYARTLGEEKYVVVFNPADREVSGSIAPLGKRAEWVYGNNPKLTKCKTSNEGHTFKMKPVSVAIYKIEN
ncbi:MAG: alpha-amylase [Alistipes sp.]|nr:alpha-amylase [Alistipes sp.]